MAHCFREPSHLSYLNLSRIVYTMMPYRYDSLVMDCTHWIVGSCSLNTSVCLLTPQMFPTKHYHAMSEFVLPNTTEMKGRILS